MEEQKQYQYQYQFQYESVSDFIANYVLQPDTNFIDYNKITFQESMMFPIVPFNQESQSQSQSQYKQNTKHNSHTSNYDSEEDEKYKKQSKEIKMSFRMDGTFDTDITETDDDIKDKKEKDKKEKKRYYRGLSEEEKLFLKRERSRESAKLFRKRKNDIINEKEKKLKEYEKHIAKLNDEVKKLNDEKHYMTQKLYLNEIILRNYEQILNENK